MLIDWFTVGAQALNFLVLVWLLRHFLYKPILDAIDAREKRIAAELGDAAAKQAEAKKERDEFHDKNADLDRHRAELLKQATDAAHAEGDRLRTDAQHAAEALQAKRDAALKNEAQTLQQAVAARAQSEVFTIARKALMDLATVSLEERIGEVFTRRLREMDAKARGELGSALKGATEPALVRSAFELPPDQRAAIQNALNETFSADIRLRFETAPAVVGGIDLTAGGQKVSWTITGYLAALEKGVSELLKSQQAAPAPKKSEDKPAPPPAAAAPEKPHHEEPAASAAAKPVPPAKPAPANPPPAPGPDKPKPAPKPEDHPVEATPALVGA